MTFRDHLKGMEFRARWQICLLEWANEHWSEINDDEWVLYSYIKRKLSNEVRSGFIKESRFSHKSYYEDGHKILEITIEIYYKNKWFKISCPVKLDINNAYKYDPREGF